MARSKVHTKNAVAQKERVNIQQVTKSQSLTLVKNLVRVSISTVCHIRNIFPRSCFQERTYAGMRIYQLDPSPGDNDTKEALQSIKQAYMLTQWLERGVFEAIECRYLRRMDLIVVSPELRLPQESYSFDLEYPESEGDNGITFSGTRVTTVDNARGQMVKLIRSLIQFSNTLEELPRERIINMKLWYYDERTPVNWEPKYFTAADPSELSFNREGDHDTLRIRIGELCTPHHNLKVRFEGIENSMDIEHDASEDDEDTQDAIGAERRSKDGGLLRCKAEQAQNANVEEGEEADEERGEDIGKHSAEPLSRPSDVSRATSYMSELSVSARKSNDKSEADGFCLEQMMGDIRSWIKEQSRPTISRLMDKFDLTRDQARQCFGQLVDEKMLRKDANRRYYLVKHSDNHHEDCMDENDDNTSSISQASSLSHDSLPLIPAGMQSNKGAAPSSMPPPPPPSSRDTGGGGAYSLNGDDPDGLSYSTPPVVTSTTPSLQPVPEKPRQKARVVSTGTKRALDEEALSEAEDTQDVDAANDFTAPMDTMGSASATGYEVSLSQASSVIQSAKCSLVREPIRQTRYRKKTRLEAPSDKSKVVARQ